MIPTCSLFFSYSLVVLCFNTYVNIILCHVNWPELKNRSNQLKSNRGRFCKNLTVINNSESWLRATAIMQPVRKWNASVLPNWKLFLPKLAVTETINTSASSFLFECNNFSKNIFSFTASRTHTQRITVEPLSSDPLF